MIISDYRKKLQANYICCKNIQYTCNNSVHIVLLNIVHHVKLALYSFTALHCLSSRSKIHIGNERRSVNTPYTDRLTNVVPTFWQWCSRPRVRLDCLFQLLRLWLGLSTLHYLLSEWGECCTYTCMARDGSWNSSFLSSPVLLFPFPYFPFPLFSLPPRHCMLRLCFRCH